MPPSTPNNAGNHYWSSYEDVFSPTLEKVFQNEVDEMYELQKRIDAGEDVVIPEKKAEPEGKWEFVGGGGFTTGTVTYHYSIDGTGTTKDRSVKLTTNPTEKNGVNKYTGKKMKYIKGKKGPWR